MARINARKIVLSYFYQRNFFLFSFQQEKVINDAFYANNIFASNLEEYQEEKKEFSEQISEYLNQDTKNLLEYIMKNFFEQWKSETIDMDYVFSVGTLLEVYRDEIAQQVDKYTTSFSYSQMSLMNQALFSLGYIEWKELNTEKEILINEMIELAKRYDEPGSPKLINAVMHKILNTIE